SVAPGVRSFLVRIARSLWLVRRLADEAPVSRRAFAAAALVLPGGIFPLPVSDVDLKARRAEQAQTNAAAVAARQQRLAQLGADLSAYRQAADEILTTFERSAAQPTANVASPRSGDARTPGPSGFVLSEAATASLSDATKA